MWSSISILQAVNGWCLVIAAVAGVIAAAAGLISGLAGNRLNDLQKAAHERELEAMRLKTAELEARAAQALKNSKFAKVLALSL